MAKKFQLGYKEIEERLQILKAAPKIVAVSDGYTLLSYDLRENHA